MKTSSNQTTLFAEKIVVTEEKLDSLEIEIADIGQPAGANLRRRLDALKVEEYALQRNFSEAEEPGKDTPHRREQLEALLHHIEREEASLEHEADFLRQSAPSSVTVAAEAGSRFLSAIGRGMKRVLKGHRPLGSSVFVNHSYDTLVTRYGLRKPKANPDEEENKQD